MRPFASRNVNASDGRDLIRNASERGDVRRNSRVLQLNRSSCGIEVVAPFSACPAPAASPLTCFKQRAHLAVRLALHMTVSQAGPNWEHPPSRTDRRKLPRQSARLPHPRRRLRGQGRALHLAGEMGRRALRHRDRPVAPRRGCLAWQLRALQIRSAAFLASGALLFDHPDPSIFTVMTVPSETPGGQRRFRHFPGALTGGGKHLPAAPGITAT
jgi:hypothetical protein